MAYSCNPYGEPLLQLYANEWCHRCQNESHAPATCAEMEEW